MAYKKAALAVPKSATKPHNKKRCLAQPTMHGSPAWAMILASFRTSSGLALSSCTASLQQGSRAAGALL